MPAIEKLDVPMIKQDYKPKTRRYRAQRLIENNNPLLAKAFVALAFGIFLYTLIHLISSSESDEEPMVKEVEAAVIHTPTAFADQEPETRPAKEIPLTLDFDSSSQDDQLAKLLTPAPIAAEPTAASQPEFDELKLSYETIRKGDNLSAIFKRLGIPARDMITLLKADKKADHLVNLMPERKLGYLKDENGLVHLEYSIDRLTTLTAKREQKSFVVNIDTKQVDIRVSQAAGTIEENLFAAGYKVGLSDKLILELAAIFQWDIDFALDIRQGDTFAFVYEERWVEGEKLENGRILAAEFINQKQKYQAVLYTDEKGNDSYYTPDGLSMRKAFLRAPLNFSYISSSFKPRRFHPIQKRWKAHRGVDYRAPTGTPVYAAGDGKVIRATYDKYNGHHVFIQHGQTYTTKYLHFSKRAVKRGQKVRQGQIIGYVGSTGMSEAPHLHYEFLVNGVHRNPRTVKLPQAEPVAKNEKQRFIKETKPLLAQLEVSSRILLAEMGN